MDEGKVRETQAVLTEGVAKFQKSDYLFNLKNAIFAMIIKKRTNLGSGKIAFDNIAVVQIEGQSQDLKAV